MSDASDANSGLIALSAVSGLAMLYVGAYQIRAIEHMSCPLLKHGCEAVADAPFARPFGIPDGFIAAVHVRRTRSAGAFQSAPVWPRYAIRAAAIVAAVANGLGVMDMTRLGAFCFYCLLTTILSPLLVWAAFVI